MFRHKVTMFRRASRGVVMGNSSSTTVSSYSADSGIAMLLAQVSADASLLQRILAAVLVAFSVVALVFALTRALKQMPIRPLFDYLRLGLQVAGVVIMARVVGVSSAPQLLAVASAVGLVVGLLQGTNLQITVAKERVWAQRSRIGVAIWGGSLIAMQIAGFANRAGVVKLGQVVAWFSVGITVGVLLGRSGNVKTARHNLKQAVVVAVVLVVSVGSALAGGDVTPATAQESGAWVRGSGRILGGAPSFPEFQPALGASGGSLDFVIPRNDGIGSEGGTLPNTIVYGAPPAQLVAGESATVSASASPGAAGAFDVGSRATLQIIGGVNGSDLSGGLVATVEWTCPLEDACTVSAASGGSVSFSLGAGSADGETATFSWRIQNCGNACTAEWAYTWTQSAPVVTTSPPVANTAPPVVTTVPPAVAPPATAAPQPNSVATVPPAAQTATPDPATAAATPTTSSQDDDDSSALPVPLDGDGGQNNDENGGGGDNGDGGDAGDTQAAGLEAEQSAAGQDDIDRSSAARQATAGLLVLVGLGLINLAEVIPLLAGLERLTGDSPFVSAASGRSGGGRESSLMTVDTDNDGVADTVYIDHDNDGVIDAIEPWPPPVSPGGASPPGTFEPLDQDPGSDIEPPLAGSTPPDVDVESSGTFEPLDHGPVSELPPPTSVPTAAPDEAAQSPGVVAPFGPQREPFETEGFSSLPRTRWSDTDGDGFYDRVEQDTDGDGILDASGPWVDPRMPPPPSEPPPPTNFVDAPTGRGPAAEGPVGPVSGDEADAGASREPTSEPAAPPGESAAPSEEPATPPEESTATESQSAESVDAVLPGDRVEVSQQEIDDIYRRGLASGRSLDDLREDIAGLSQARGGTADVGNPYDLELQQTDAGLVPLTPAEFTEYRKAQSELAGLFVERDRQQRQWKDYLNGRERLRDRETRSAAVDVWNAESRFQERIQTERDWAWTWTAWRRGERFRFAPDGSSYNETFEHMNDPYFEGNRNQYAQEQIERHERRASELESQRIAFMDAAHDKPGILQEEARLDALERELIERRRVLSEPINRARDRVNRLQSYGSGSRPLPGSEGAK